MGQAIPKSMRAVAIDRFGGLETLKLQSLPVPQIRPDDVLIRVEAAGVGAWDPFEREGGFAQHYGVQPKFPYVLGTDGAGTIAAVGTKVDRFKEGDRVYAIVDFPNTRGGFYAEYTAVRAENVSQIPANLPFDQAGVMPVDAMTALRGLDDTLHLKPGESALIFGASGGIGHLAVQLAKRMGVRVFAVASGDDGVAFVKRLGADGVANGRKEDIAAAARNFASNGLDAALLTAGGDAAEKALAAVRNGGRVAYPTGVEPEPKARPGVTINRYDGMPDRQAIDKLNRLIESGPFEAHVGHMFPLEKAADAHRALDEHHLGKLGLRIR